MVESTIDPGFVRDGVVDDPSFLPMIYAAGPTDDWTDPEVWKRANPGYGISVKEEDLRIACEQAKRMCRAIELKPEYVAVILQRWVDSGLPDPVKIVRGANDPQ